MKGEVNCAIRGANESLTFLQCQKLLLNSTHESIVDEKLHVFSLVLLRDGNLRAVWFKLVNLEDAKAVRFNTECRLNDVCDVVFAEKRN